MKALLKMFAGNVLFLWVLVAGLVVFMLVGRLSKRPSALEDQTRALQTILASTRASDQRLIDSLRGTAALASRNGAIASGKANQLLEAADRQKMRIETLVLRAKARPLTPVDTVAQLWKDAYDARTVEADTLRQALASKDSAYREATRSANLFRLAVDTSDGRRRSLEAVNADLAAAVKKSERGCRFLFIPCPTRTQTAVAGIVVGAATMLALESRKP